MDDVCTCQVIHRDAVERARGGLAGEFELLEMAEMFKVLGDGTRLRIINALLVSELCVCDVAAVMGMSHPAVSHHLKILRQARLVRCRKEGKIVYYALCDEHVGMLFEQCKNHVGEE